MDTEPLKKTCGRCKKEKLLSLFTKDNSTKDRKAKWCGDCCRKKDDTYRKGTLYGTGKI